MPLWKLRLRATYYTSNKHFLLGSRKPRPESVLHNGELVEGSSPYRYEAGGGGAGHRHFMANRLSAGFQAWVSAEVYMI